MVSGPDFPSYPRFYSTLNWQPTVNGETGYTPPVYGDLYAATQPDRLLSSQTIAMLQGMGVRWLVWHLNDESMPLDPAQWQELQPKLDSSKFLKLAYSNATDRVYELVPDEWMVSLSNLMPKGAGLIVSDVRREQPMLMELTETILQRNEHSLYGSGRAGYRFLNDPPTGQPISYGLFASDENPALYGFNSNEVIWHNDWLKLYKRNDNIIASYDLSHNSKLSSYNQVKGNLTLQVGENSVKFNGQEVGSGQGSAGKAQLELTFGALSDQSVNLTLPDGSQQKLDLKAGLTTWRSADLASGSNLKIEAQSGQILYLNRADLVSSSNQTGVTGSNSAVAIISNSSHQDGNNFVSDFQVLAPVVENAKTPVRYNFTLDVYKRPWGSANSGHFGTWTVALTGSGQPQNVEFRSDPTNHQTTVTVDGKKADIGSQPLDTREGPYTAYISLWQLNPQDPKAATQLGVAPLYDFSLNTGQLSEINLLPERELVFAPPLK